MFQGPENGPPVGDAEISFLVEKLRFTPNANILQSPQFVVYTTLAPHSADCSTSHCGRHCSSRYLN